MVDAKSFKRLMLEGTRTGLVVRFASSKIFAVDEIQQIGREFLRAVDLAVRIDMPLILSFRGVEDFSGALVGKILLLRKKVKSQGIKLRICDISPALREVFRRRMGEDGVAAE
jgi:anti-sigma B factor antagonist